MSGHCVFCNQDFTEPCLEMHKAHCVPFQERVWAMALGKRVKWEFKTVPQTDKPKRTAADRARERRERLRRAGKCNRCGKPTTASECAACRARPNKKRKNAI